MTIATITKRIEGKEKEIAKLTAKAERIAKAKATDWEINPYYYSEYDERITAKDLEAARKSLAEYQEMLRTETEKANSRNIEVIIRFLENWKEAIKKYYSDTFAKYPEALKQYEEDMKQFKLGYWEERKLREKDPAAYREYKENRDAVHESFRNRFGFLEPYVNRVPNPNTFLYDMYELDNLKLAKDLDDEADRKYDFIIERTNHYVGQITDASNLTIGAKGDLNGYIIGTTGKAKVQTIGAGGYNIQCYHFRTLINRLK